MVNRMVLRFKAGNGGLKLDSVRFDLCGGALSKLNDVYVLKTVRYGAVITQNDNFH